MRVGFEFQTFKSTDNKMKNDDDDDDDDDKVQPFG